MHLLYHRQSVKVIQALAGHGSGAEKPAAWLILPAVLVLMMVLVVHAWLVRADPPSNARSLINSERRRLEHILTPDYPKDGAGTLFKRKLRQRSLWKLTRLFIAGCSILPFSLP